MRRFYFLFTVHLIASKITPRCRRLTANRFPFNLREIVPTMKRLNIKLLSILGIAFLVIMGGVVVVHGIQMKRNVDSLIKRAEDSKESDPATAVWLYQRYRQYKPEDQERKHADYAVLVSDQAKLTGDERLYFESIDALQKAMLNTKRPELKRKLIDLKMAFRQYTNARDDLEELKKKMRPMPTICFSWRNATSVLSTIWMP